MYLEHKFQEFIEKVKTQIEKMENQEFLDTKSLLLMSVYSEPESMMDECENAWITISKNETNIEREKQEKLIL